jgi:hypothetical protein
VRHFELDSEGVAVLVDGTPTERTIETWEVGE